MAHIPNPMQPRQQPQQQTHHPQPPAHHTVNPTQGAEPMTTQAKPKRVKYKTKTIHVSGFNPGKVARYVARGWEVVSTYGGALGTAQTVTLRKAK